MITVAPPLSASLIIILLLFLSCFNILLSDLDILHLSLFLNDLLKLVDKLESVSLSVQYFDMTSCVVSSMALIVLTVSGGKRSSGGVQSDGLVKGCFSCLDPSSSLSYIDISFKLRCNLILLLIIF